MRGAREAHWRRRTQGLRLGRPDRPTTDASLIRRNSTGGQFIYGFDTVGSLFRNGAFQSDPTAKGPGDISTIFETSRAILGTRSRISDCRSSDLLWRDAVLQAKSGRVADAFPVDGDATVKIRPIWPILLDGHTDRTPDLVRYWEVTHSVSPRLSELGIL